MKDKIINVIAVIAMIGMMAYVWNNPPPPEHAQMQSDYFKRVAEEGKKK